MNYPCAKVEPKQLAHTHSQQEPPSIHNPSHRRIIPERRIPIAAAPVAVSLAGIVAPARLTLIGYPGLY